LVRSSLGRAQDAGFRCGGDEFVIVLPSCPPGPARQLAERLSKLVDAMARTLKVTPRPGLSVGVCSASELGPGASPEELLKEADRRLYETKRARHGSERRPAA
jgi:two-component system cell cycle response regulator